MSILSISLVFWLLSGLARASPDVAARLNFCTVDAGGNVSDRRAGRIPTETCQQLCAMLAAIDIPGVEVTVAPEMEYRAAVIFRGAGLGDGVSDYLLARERG